MNAAAIFRALGDPTRLAMVERLSSGESYTITTVSHDLNITRQGARKHLQILADSDLVTLAPHGRNTQVRLERTTLEQAKAFIAELEQQWDLQLEALRQFVDED